MVTSEGVDCSIYRLPVVFFFPNIEGAHDSDLSSDRRKTERPILFGGEWMWKHIVNSSIMRTTEISINLYSNQLGLIQLNFSSLFNFIKTRLYYSHFESTRSLSERIIKIYWKICFMKRMANDISINFSSPPPLPLELEMQSESNGPWNFGFLETYKFYFCSCPKSNWTGIQ